MGDKEWLAEMKNSQANEVYKLGQFSNALYMYEKAIELNPNVAKYYGNKSACYFMLGEHLKAQSIAQKAIDLDQKYFKGYIRIVKCCIITGNLKYAVSTLEKGLQNFPTNEEIKTLNEKIQFLLKHFNDFETILSKKNYIKALKAIEKCLQKEPDCILFLLRKAKCLMHLQKYDEAQKTADNILKNNKNDEDAICIKSFAQCYKSNIKVALETIKKLKSQFLDHKQVSEIYNKTILIDKNINEIEECIQGLRYEEAYKLIKITVKIDPNYYLINKQLRLRLLDIASVYEPFQWQGITDCDIYIHLYGKDLDLLKCRAKLSMASKEYEDAVEDYKEILQLENNNENNENLQEAQTKYEEQLKDDVQILKLTGNPTKSEIEKAAKNLKIKYHPDKHPKASPERILILQKKMYRVNEALKRLHISAK